MAKFQQAVNFIRREILSHNQSYRKQLSLLGGNRKFFLSAVQSSFSNEPIDSEVEESRKPEKFKQNEFLKNSNQPIDLSLEKRQPLPVLNSFQEIAAYINNNQNLKRFVIMHLLYNMQNIHFPTRSMRLEYLENELVNTPAFVKFSQNIEQNLHSFNHKELLTIVKFFNLCNVPLSSTIYQKLLKLILDNFNKFDMLQVLNLHSTFVNSKESNLYLIHVKLACLEHMAYCSSLSDLVGKSVDSLVHFAQKSSTPIFMREKLMNIILDSNLKWQDPKLFSRVSSAIAKLNFENDTRVWKFMNTIQSEVNKNWTPNDVESITKYFAVACSVNRIPYHENFFDKMASVAVENHYPIEHAIKIMRNLLLLPHMNHSLLNYIVNQIFKSEEINFANVSNYDFYCMLVVLGKTCAGQNGFEENMQLYRDKLMFFSDLSNVESLPNVQKIFAVLYFAVFGIYNNDIIRSALRAYELNSDKEESIFFKWCLLLFNQTLAVMHPSYDEPKLPDSIFEELADSISSTFSSSKWIDVIESSLGGENYILRNCTTSLHHFLSYVVILDENNRPVDLSLYKEGISSRLPVRIDQMNVDPNYKVLVILEFPPAVKMYCKNTNFFLGFGVLYVKILEAMGYHVAHIQREKFDELMEVERVPYFLNLIEQKCGGLQLQGSPLETNANN